MIRDYSLYGETDHPSDPVHCEEIATRSSLHDWELKPHRHQRLHQVLVISSGRCDTRLDDRQIVAGDHCVINVPPGVVHGFRFTRDVRGHVMTLTRDMADTIIAPGSGVIRAIQQSGIYPASGRIIALLQEIQNEYNGAAFARHHMLASLTGQVLGQIARAIAARHAEPVQSAPHHLVARYRQLLEEGFRQSLGIADYASRLGVTPPHLSRQCRQVTGSSASALLYDRQMREARRMLIFTTAPVAEIGYTLGFEDPAYFSRFFNKHAGMSPARFRQSN